MERLAQGKLDMVVGRLFERHDKSACVTRRSWKSRSARSCGPGHPLLANTGLTLRDVVGSGWIVPLAGQRAAASLRADVPEGGLESPTNLIETTALLFVTKMLQAATWSP